MTEAYSPTLGRAMGYYISSLVAGGLVGRVEVALATAATSWRAALAGVAVLPLVSTLLMRARLPEEPEDPAGGGEPLTRADMRRVLGNRRLLAAVAAGAGLFFTFVGTFSYVTFRLGERRLRLARARGRRAGVLPCGRSGSSARWPGGRRSATAGAPWRSPASGWSRRACWSRCPTLVT